MISLAAEVNMVAQKCRAPTLGAAKALRRIMVYVSGSADRKPEVPDLELMETPTIFRRGARPLCLLVGDG